MQKQRLQISQRREPDVSLPPPGKPLRDPVFPCVFDFVHIRHEHLQLNRTCSAGKFQQGKTESTSRTPAGLETTQQYKKRRGPPTPSKPATKKNPALRPGNPGLAYYPQPPPQPPPTRGVRRSGVQPRTAPSREKKVSQPHGVWGGKGRSRFPPRFLFLRVMSVWRLGCRFPPQCQGWDDSGIGSDGSGGWCPGLSRNSKCALQRIAGNHRSVHEPGRA